MRVAVYRADDRQLLWEDVDFAWWHSRTVPHHSGRPRSRFERSQMKDALVFYEKNLQDSAIKIEIMTVGDFIICKKGQECPTCGGLT